MFISIDFHVDTPPSDSESDEELTNENINPYQFPVYGETIPPEKSPEKKEPPKQYTVFEPTYTAEFVRQQIELQEKQIKESPTFRERGKEQVDKQKKRNTRN